MNYQLIKTFKNFGTMDLAEYNNTTSSIEGMIHSEEIVNCETACEILKGLDWPNGMKLDILEPFVSNYLLMAKGLKQIGTMEALLKAKSLLDKMTHLNNAVAFINK